MIVCSHALRVSKDEAQVFCRSHKQSLQYYFLGFGAKGRHGRYASGGEAESILPQWHTHAGLLADLDAEHNSIREE